MTSEQLTLEKEIEERGILRASGNYEIAKIYAKRSAMAQGWT